MKRKTSSVPTRIWSFWCHKPVHELDRLNEQFQLARVYKNKLIEIEKERRAKREALLAAQPAVALVQAQIDELTKKIETLRAHVSGEHQDKRDKKTSPQSRSELKALKEARRDLYKKLKNERASIRESLQDALEKIDNESYEASKAAYGESSCFWGTKLLINKEMEQAKKSPTGPQFRRWDGGGRVGIQIQKGMPISDLFTGEDTRIRLMRSDPSLPQTGKRALDSAMMRIGSDDKSQPIWTKFPCLIHRDLPREGVIKWAWLRRYKVGPRMKYELSLVLESQEFGALKPRKTQEERMCAIDIGWRKRPEAHLRFAYLWDGEQAKELALPSKIESHFEKADDLHSIRQKLFNEERKALSSWLDEHPESSVANFFPYLEQWKSPAKLARAFNLWKKQRVHDDALIFAKVSEWMRRENHLYRWESGARERTLNSRLEIYRQAAREIASTYSIIVIEEFDLRNVIERKSVENKDKEMHDEARSQRFQAAVSEFRQQLREQAQKFGSRIIEVPAENTTLTCHLCMFTEKWDKAPSVMHECGGCKETWDQDFNAAVNLYGRGVVALSNERPNDEEKPRAARMKESKDLQENSSFASP